MNTDTYRAADPRATDQELLKNLSQCFQGPDTADSFEEYGESDPTVNIIDHPCGFGKTNALIAIINERIDLNFLVVVQTLDEIERVLVGTSEGRLMSPEGPGSSRLTKGMQLESLVKSGVSIVITHALYERAGELAYQGGLKHYHVVIDEVPSAVSVDSKLSLESFREVYLDNGYCKMTADGMVLPTDKGIQQAERLKEVLNEQIMKSVLSGRLFHDQNQHLIQTIPVFLFTESVSVTVLTFMAEGTLFTQFLRKSGIPFSIIKSAHTVGAFRKSANQNLKLDTISALESIRLSYNKQQTYGPKSDEAKTVAVALKNLKQRMLVGVALKDVILTCNKSTWYHTARSQIDISKPGPFSKDSRMFKGMNWLPNTTRGTNNYSHCSHAIYLYEQNANPILLKWLGTDNRVFGDAYALAEMIQWIWRTRVRIGKPVHVFMPSKRMRGILSAWMAEG